MPGETRSRIHVLHAADVSRVVELECVHDHIDDAVDRDHDEHADETIYKVLTAIPVCFTVLNLPQIFDNTDEEKEKAQREYHRNNRINHEGVDALQYRQPSVCIHIAELYSALARARPEVPRC